MSEFEDIIQKTYSYKEDKYAEDPRWGILHELFVRNFQYAPLLCELDYDVLPRKIHQIWLGGELPEQYKRWADTWKEKNPQWEYRLWTDRNVDEVQILRKDLYDKIENNGQKSDFLRYHILLQHGGLYVDTDFECLRSFDPLTYLEFLTGIAYAPTVELYIGLIGCVPGHPIIQRIVEDMDKTADGDWKEIFNTTGTYFFTKKFFDVVQSYREGVVALPTDYFYPFPNSKVRFVRKAEDYIQPCSYAVHHWEVSWKRHKHK